MIKIEVKSYAPIVLFVILLVLSFLIIKPFLSAVFLGALLAYILYPLYNRGRKKIRNETLTALLICLIVIILILIPSFFFVKTLTKEAYSLYVLGKQKLSVGLFEDCTNSFCNLVKELSKEPQVGYHFQEILKSATNWVIKKGSEFLVSIPSLLLNLFVVFFSLFYFLREGGVFVRKAGLYLSMKEKRYKEIMERLKEIVHAIIYGYVLVALMQGILGAIGFFLFGISSPLFWGVIMFFLALIPYLGTGIVWIPAAAIIFLNGIFQNSDILIYKGIGLFIYGVIIVGGLDNLIRPKIVGRKARIHPALILVGVLGGIFLMGPIGMIAGPLILGLTIMVIEEHLNKKREEVS